MNQSEPSQSARADVPGDQPVTAEDRAIPMQGNRINSRDIFLATREIIIAHGDDNYRLRLTAQNKLILTK